MSHANNTNITGSSGHVRKDIGQLEVVRQSNINFDASNKVEHEGLDSAIVSTVKIVNETLHKALIAQDCATEVCHMKTVHPVLATLEEQLFAFLFGHGNINVAFDKMRMLSHICPLPKGLVPTSFVQEWLGKITVIEICATLCKCLVQGIVAALPLINGVMRQVGCTFTLTVGGNHGMQRRHTNAATHAMASDNAQEIKNVSFGG